MVLPTAMATQWLMILSQYVSLINGNLYFLSNLSKIGGYTQYVFVINVQRLNNVNFENVKIPGYPRVTPRPVIAFGDTGKKRSLHQWRTPVENSV